MIARNSLSVFAACSILPVARAHASFRALAPVVERLRRVHDLVAVASEHANATDGFEASLVQRPYAFFKARYGAPASRNP